MKIQRLIFSLLLCLVLTSSYAQDFSSSVVAILKGESVVGTGFLFVSNQYVVTTLHIVAGPGAAAGLKVRDSRGNVVPVVGTARIVQAADLVILTISSGLTGAPMPLSTARVVPGSHYTRYTFSGDGQTVERKPGFKLLSGPVGLSTLFTEQTARTARAAIQAQTYPALNCQVVRINDKIRKSDSGAPICDQYGLVGIIDGGVYHGKPGGYNWAIHAQTYLNREVLENAPSNLNLAQLPRPQNGVFMVSDDIENTTPVEIDAEGLDLEYLYTTTVGEFLSWNYGLDQEMREYYNASFRESGRRVLNAKIDFYEEYYSGAVLALPHNTKVKFSEVLHSGMEQIIYFGFVPDDPQISSSMGVELRFVVSSDYDQPPGNIYLEVVREDFPKVSYSDGPTRDGHITEYSYILEDQYGGASDLSYTYYDYNYDDDDPDAGFHDFLGVEIIRSKPYHELSDLGKYYFDLFLDCSWFSELTDYDE